MPYAPAAVVCTGYVLGSAASVDPTSILLRLTHYSSSSAVDPSSCLMTSFLAPQRLHYSSPDVS